MDILKDPMMNRADLHTALDRHRLITSRDKHKTLEGIAANCPDVIREEISELRTTIALLEEYAPPNAPGDQKR